MTFIPTPETIEVPPRVPGDAPEAIITIARRNPGRRPVWIEIDRGTNCYGQRAVSTATKAVHRPVWHTDVFQAFGSNSSRAGLTLAEAVDAIAGEETFGPAVLTALRKALDL